MINQISVLGLRNSTSSQLETQMSTLQQLDEELASGQQNQNLTDYTPTTAVNLMNFQNTINERQSYLTSMNVVQSRLSVYDTTMTDMESVASQAQQLAAQNSVYDPTKVSEIQQQVVSYLKQTSDDLNQQIGGRYVYAGTRFSTQPVKDLSTVPATASYPFNSTTSPALPTYDSQYVGGLGMGIVGQTITISGTINTPQNISVEVNGTQYNYAVQGSDTPTTIAAALSTLIGAAIPGTSSTGPVLTIGGTGTINAATPDSSTSAYTQDSATVDEGYSVQYGVTSNNPAFQQLIAGLQLMTQATQSGNAATYATDMQNASSLLQTALSSLQSVHTEVAANTNILQQETSTQNTDITNLQNQLSNLSSVDTTQVSTEITSLQSQLDASYSATGSILKLSLVNYL